MPSRQPVQHVSSSLDSDEENLSPSSQEDDSDEDDLVRNLRKVSNLKFELMFSADSKNGSTYFKQALSDSQKVAMQYRKENSKLKEEIAVLKVQQPVISKGRKTKTASSDPVVASIEEDIEKLGRFFQLFYSPFIEPATFTHPKPAFNYDHPNRFSPGEDRLLGTVAELYECVPEKYYKVMREYKGFHSKV
jgi:hypothetical protein